MPAMIWDGKVLPEENRFEERCRETVRGRWRETDRTGLLLDHTSHLREDIVCIAANQTHRPDHDHQDHG